MPRVETLLPEDREGLCHPTSREPAFLVWWQQSPVPFIKTSGNLGEPCFSSLCLLLLLLSCCRCPCRQCYMCAYPYAGHVGLLEDGPFERIYGWHNERPQAPDSALPLGTCHFGALPRGPSSTSRVQRHWIRPECECGDLLGLLSVLPTEDATDWSSIAMDGTTVNGTFSLSTAVGPTRILKSEALLCSHVH